MMESCSDLGELSEDEKRLVAFFRSQPLRIKEILMNITIFEKGSLPDKSMSQKLSDNTKGKNS